MQRTWQVKGETYPGLDPHDPEIVAWARATWNALTPDDRYLVAAVCSGPGAAA